MASPSSPQHEPTMEEILASIRKIISEDSSDSQPAAASPAVAAAQETDVLELTQEVQEVPPAPAVQPSPVRAPAPAPEPARTSDDVVFQSIEETPVSVVARTPASEGLISEKTRSAIDDALAGLDFGRDESAPASRAAPVARPASPLPAGGSVEAVFDRAVRETFDPVLRAWLNDQGEVLMERMKPAIREWMEQHLPDMLKAAVEEEVARAVRTRAKR